MTYGPRHYVPVLKLKGGEKQAMPHLTPQIRSVITPLFEVVKRKTEKTIGDHLGTTFKKFADVVQGLGRFYLDPLEVEPDGEPAVKAVFDGAAGHPFTPVTGLTRMVDPKITIAAATDGIAIRIRRNEVEEELVAAALSAFLKKHALKVNRTDLILDMGAVGQMIPIGISRLTKEFLSSVPNLTDWRTVTLVGSAFPSGLGRVARYSHGFEERAEWVSWRQFAYGNRLKLARLPTFGDYGIQYPGDLEDVDFTKVAVPASIRYTLEDQWLLMKGESHRKKKLSAQFPILADELVNGTLAKFFSGAAHCAGCSDIDQSAKGAEGLGSATVWRRVGTVHHITKTVGQIQALAWP